MFVFPGKKEAAWLLNLSGEPTYKTINLWHKDPDDDPVVDAMPEDSTNVATQSDSDKTGGGGYSNRSGQIPTLKRKNKTTLSSLRNEPGQSQNLQNSTVDPSVGKLEQNLDLNPKISQPS